MYSAHLDNEDCVVRMMGGLRHPVRPSSSKGL